MSGQGVAGDLHSVAEHRLRRIDQRYTAGRRAIIGLLVSAGHPVSIGEIAGSLPDLPRSSAYRHVTLPAGFEQDVAEAIGQLADAESFQARSHRLDVLGTCAACQLASLG
jgi:Fe2+ or Zn2+ uptake regulation protein